LVYLYISRNFYNVIVVKLDRFGDILWSKSYDFSDLADEAGHAWLPGEGVGCPYGCYGFALLWFHTY
ncbi:MAG: hypothetical protein DRO18_08285, partial [Thermoprotei archaeon]